MNIKRLYYSPRINRVIASAGIDQALRKGWHYWKKYQKGNRKIQIHNISVEFAEYSLLNEEDLQVELEVLDDLVCEVDEEDVFYDVGADAGLYSCLIGNVISDGGNIIAFEPHPSRRIQLRDNLRQNKIPASVQAEALANSEGIGYINYGLETEDGNIVEDSKLYSNRIHLRKGDTLVRNNTIPSPNIIKIDVEGAELEVIRGLKTTLAKNDVRAVYIEVHEKIRNFGGNIDELKKLLNELGFKIHVIRDRGSETFLKCTK